MKNSETTTSQRCRSLLVNLLLVGLLFSSGTSRNAKTQARQIAEKPGPTSIHSAKTLLRNHALMSSPGQRVAGDISKQNRVKHPVTYIELAPAEAGAPAAIVRQRLVTTDRSVSYLSFRLSRPGGRAPPVSA